MQGALGRSLESLRAAFDFACYRDAVSLHGDMGPVPAREGLRVRLGTRPARRCAGDARVGVSRVGSIDCGMGNLRAVRTALGTARRDLLRALAPGQIGRSTVADMRPVRLPTQAPKGSAGPRRPAWGH